MVAAWTFWFSLRFHPGPLFWQAIPFATAISFQLLPWLEVVRAPRDIRPIARRWVGYWALAFFVSDILQTSLATGGPILWFVLVAFPVEDACLLWAYSYWQIRPIARLTFRAGIPAVTVVFLGLAAWAGETNDFQVVSGLFRFLVMLSALSYTLVTRARVEMGRIWERDWLWVSLGALLYYGAFVGVIPVTAALLPENVQLARLVYVVKAAVDTIAFVLVWKGTRCPVETSSPSISLPYLRSS